LRTFLFLIKQDTPLELFEIFQKLAAEQNKEILTAIKALLEIGQAKEGGKLTSDHLSPLLNHISHNPQSSKILRQIAFSQNLPKIYHDGQYCS
jgi:hypothetical protein